MAEIVGGVLLSHTIRFVCDDNPMLFDTIKATTKFVATPDGAEKVCDGFAELVNGEPSPKFH